MEAFGCPVTFVSREDGVAWHYFDGERRGPRVLFETVHGGSTITIRVLGPDCGERQVGIASAHPLTQTLEQFIKRNADSWERSVHCEDRVYTPLGFTRWKGNRLGWKRVETSEDILQTGNPQFEGVCMDLGIELLPYEEATGTSTSSSLKAKLCPVVGIDEFEKMVAVFIGAKLVPVLA